MPDVSFEGLAIVLAVAFAVPLALGAVPRLPLPAVVGEVLAGVLIGPALLGWVEVDEVLRVLAIVGLAFLLFLAGMELDLRHLRGRVLRLGLAGFGASLVLAGVVGLALDAGGLVDDPVLAAVILTATALGIVIGVLEEVGAESTPMLGGARGAIAAGLLQATSLPFIVVATEIGVAVGSIDAETAAAFVAAGLLSTIIFPAVATALLRPTPDRVAVEVP